jgi:hypothetical protein
MCFAQFRPQLRFGLQSLGLAQKDTSTLNDIIYYFTMVVDNSYLFNEFVCNLGFFWHEWTSLKLE